MIPETAPMTEAELGRFVCVHDCHYLERTITSNGVWVKTGTVFSSAHRECLEAQNRKAL